MDRPASRGLLAGGVQKAPTGLAVEKPDRPSTASRPGGSFCPPGTAGSRGSASGPPSTAIKRVSQSTSHFQQAGQAQARPLTQQGMGGLKPSTAAAGRQVLDRIYFVNELRHKRQQLAAVIGQMQEDLEVLDHKKAASARAEKLSGQLKKEVRVLQEALADNNIIIDKAGSQAPLQQIHAELSDIKARNETQQARVQDIVAQRLSLDQQAKQLETQIQAAQTAQEQRLNGMEPSARQEYNELVAVQASLQAEVGRFEEESAELTAALNAAEGELSRNGFKQRVLEVQEQIRVLTQRKVELAAAEEAASAAPEQQKEVLMARIKRENGAVEQLTAEAKHLQAQVKQLEAHQGDAASNAAANKADGSVLDDPVKRAKYEELQMKERELTTFMDAFPQRRAVKQQEIKAKQDTIIKLLGHLTKRQQGYAGDTAMHAAAAGSPPGSMTQHSMQSRVALNYAPAAAAAAAGDGVGSNGTDIEAKRAEHQKLEELEGKITVELQTLQGQVSDLQAEVDAYADIEGARRGKTATRDDLEREQASLRARLEALQADMADQEWQQQTKEAQLKQHAAWPFIDRLDQQLKQVQQQCEKARESIRSHEEKSNYTPLVPQLVSMISSINEFNIAAVTGA